MDFPRFLPSGDRGLIVEYEEEISRKTNEKVRSLYTYLDKKTPPGCVELVPSYRALLVEYDPLTTTYHHLLEYLKQACEQAQTQVAPPPRVIEIPTLYGGEFGIDLQDVASYNKLTPEEVVAIHSGTDYLVYMIGFTPGFPYLGEMDPRIACPRKKTPRQKIARGSVGIAGQQTGIYPLDSPGGWQIIGRTPLELFSPYMEPAVLLNPGDLVRFVPISESEYAKYGRETND